MAIITKEISTLADDGLVFVSSAAKKVAWPMNDQKEGAMKVYGSCGVWCPVWSVRDRAIREYHVEIVKNKTCHDRVDCDCTFHDSR